MDQDRIVESLKKYTTCDVSDALLKFKYPHGGYLPNLTLWSPQRQEGDHKIVGPAYTVRYVKNNYENEPKLAGHYIDSVPKGSVIFISAPSGTINAVYGGLMSARAKVLGAAGSVIDGSIRDLQEHRSLEYPVFARAVGTPAPYEVVRVSETNCPVHFQNESMDITINAGDYIIGDLNGVVCLPKELAEKVVDLMPSLVEADEKVARDILSGKSFVEASKEHRVGLRQP